MTVQRILTLFCSAAFWSLLTLASPVAAEEIRIEHAQGETVLPAPPQRVLTFDLASLDTLDALGVEVTGVPGSHIPAYLGRYTGDGFLKVGTLFQPDMEAVAAAKPDLIIVATRSASQYGKLSRIAPTIDLTVDPGNFLQSVKDNARLLGRIFGRVVEAEAKIGALEKSIDILRETAAGKGDALIIMTNGGSLSAFAQGSRFGWVHGDLGIEATDTGVKASTHGEAISFEFLAQADPQWLIVLDRDAAVGQSGNAARQTLDNELVASTQAAKKDQIIYADAVRWYIAAGGLDATQSAVNELIDAFGAKD